MEATLGWGEPPATFMVEVEVTVVGETEATKEPAGKGLDGFVGLWRREYRDPMGVKLHL